MTTGAPDWLDELDELDLHASPPEPAVGPRPLDDDRWLGAEPAGERRPADGVRTRGRARGVSVSALVTSAADARADEILHAHATMTVPADVFDDLLAALDQQAPLAPALDKAHPATL